MRQALMALPDQAVRDIDPAWFVILHLLAVAWYARLRRRPLVRAMLTGRVDARVAPPGAAIHGSGTLRAILIVAVLALVLALAIRAAPDVAVALF